MNSENQRKKDPVKRSTRWDFHETVINSERFAEKVKNKTLKFIEEASVRYLENFPEQSDRDPSVLWRLAFAYDQSAKKISGL